MQLHNEGETKQDREGFVVFRTCVCVLVYSSSISPVHSGHVVLLVAECLQKKKRGESSRLKEEKKKKKRKNPSQSLLFLGCAEQRFLDGEQNCAPVFWHRSVTRADRETESVGAEGAAFIWCEKHCWSDTFNGNFLALCCHLK